MKKEKKLSKKKHSKPLAKTTDQSIFHLERVLELMERHQLSELEWEKAGGEKLRLKSKYHLPENIISNLALHSSFPEATLQKNNPGFSSSPSSQDIKNTSSFSEVKTASSSQSQVQYQKVVSPFVGTFYRAASPAAQPYVLEGQRVKKGDVLCIVEAMKLMNEIESEFTGKIVSILVENGQPIEFSEPLFLIEP